MTAPTDIPSACGAACLGSSLTCQRPPEHPGQHAASDGERTFRWGPSGGKSIPHREFRARGKTRIDLYVDASEADALDELCSQLGRTRSDVIRAAIVMVTRPNVRR